MKERGRTAPRVSSPRGVRRAYPCPLSGPDLQLNRETQFSVDEAVRIAREIADALDYAHRQG